MAEVDAHILLADISGYTRFLKENTVTLSHATQIVTDLLEAVMDGAEKPVHPNKVEGDAVLFVAPEDKPGQASDAAWASIQNFFSAFYRRRAELQAANTCPCEACTRIDELNLKVISHHGRLLRHKVSRFEEVSGFDLVIAHRLLKNQVEGSRYVLSTEAAWDHYPTEDGLEVQRHEEECEGVGMVPVVVLRDAPDKLSASPSPCSCGLIGKLADWARKHVVLIPGLGPLLLGRKHLAQRCSLHSH